MNIVEAIDILKNSIADYVIGEYCEKCADNKICDDRNEDCYYQQAIDIVVTAYEKEKEKNKELNKYIEDRAKIGKNIQTFINKDYVEQEYISKEKIREILEYYKWTPADDTDSTIAFYSDIKKLLKGEIREEDVDEFILK